MSNSQWKTDPKKELAVLGTNILIVAVIFALLFLISSAFSEKRQGVRMSDSQFEARCRDSCTKGIHRLDAKNGTCFCVPEVVVSR